MFELLILVSGVGVKSAIIILSNISPSKFALAVVSNDVSVLTQIPGIGAKTAARIVLELKDRMKTQEAIIKDNKEVQDEIVIENNKQEVVMALKVLGYNKLEIDKVIEGIDTKNISIEDAIRKALSYLSK